MTEHFADRDLELDPHLHLDDDHDDHDDHDDADRVAPPVTLSLLHRLQLAAAVNTGLQRNGCDTTLRAARRWATAAGVSWPELQSQLEGNGGCCDCEVSLNILFPGEPEPD